MVLEAVKTAPSNAFGGVFETIGTGQCAVSGCDFDTCCCAASVPASSLSAAAHGLSIRQWQTAIVSTWVDVADHQVDSKRKEWRSIAPGTDRVDPGHFALALPNPNGRKLIGYDEAAGALVSASASLCASR